MRRQTPAPAPVARERDKNVGHAHQYHIDLAAKVPGGHAQQQAQRPDGDRDQQHDIERDARAIDQAAEDIAAKLVGAEPVRRIRRRERYPRSCTSGL